MNKNKKGNSVGLGIIIAIVVVLIIGAVFFFITDRDRNVKMTKTLETASKDYFNNYMSVNSGANAYKVTLKMLKDANKNGSNYNLNNLDKCDDEKTYAMVNVDFSNGLAKDTEIILNCKKF